MNSSFKAFGNTASKLSRSPLGIVALFIVLVYGIAALVVLIPNHLTVTELAPLIYFLVLFPVVVFFGFLWLVSRHPDKLYSPSDFKDEKNFLTLKRISPEKDDDLSTIARARAMPNTPEPEDVARAKDLIAKYVNQYAIPASVAVQEAVRKSAYVVKDSDPDSPLSHFAWVGVLDGGDPKTQEWNGLADPDVYRIVPIEIIEAQLLKNTVNYRKAVHTLNRVITTLGPDGKPLKTHGLLSDLGNWLPLHERLKEQFSELRTTPQLKKLHSVRTSIYFDDPNYPDQIFYEAIQNT